MNVFCIIIRIVMVGIVSTLLGCRQSPDQTNGLPPENTSEATTVYIDPTAEAIGAVFRETTVLRITDAAHINEIMIHTDEKTFCIRDGISHWGLVMKFKDAAEKEGKKIPMLHLD